MKTNYEIMKELVMDQDLTTEVRLKDLYEFLCDNEKLRKRVEELEERNRLLEQNVAKDGNSYFLQNKINTKISRDGFITDSDIKKYWDECYCDESEKDEHELIGLWPNGELIPLELSGLKFYDMYIYNALRRAGIKHIEELKDKTYEWLISLPNIGKGRADKLQDCLYRTWGFKLKEE